MQAPNPLWLPALMPNVEVDDHDDEAAIHQKSAHAFKQLDGVACTVSQELQGTAHTQVLRRVYY